MIIMLTKMWMKIVMSTLTTIIPMMITIKVMSIREESIDLTEATELIIITAISILIQYI